MSATYQQLTSSATSKIVNLLTNCCHTQTHLRQIQAHLILQFLHSDTTVALHYITAAERLHLLRPSLPHLFLSHRCYKPHVFTCNTLIKAFAANPHHQVPLLVYTHMLRRSVRPNNYTFPFLLKSLSNSRRFDQGQSVHSHLVKLGGHLTDIYVLNSLLHLYASSPGGMKLCRQVFDEMPERDVVSWTVLITGYRNDFKYDDALIAFETMQFAGLVPNPVTMVNALGACGGCGAIEMGIWIHEFITRNGWELDVTLGTALVDMYLKCGRVEEGKKVFMSMKIKNLYTWNVLIKGLGHAKCGTEAVSCFRKMERDRLEVDHITLVNVLSACSHSGLVEEGKRIFGSLVKGEYGFGANIKHYACMVDVLARAGCLHEALECISGMQGFEPTKSMWGSLMNGCREFGDLEMAKFVGEKLVELEPENGAYYIVLCNVYGEMGRWDDVTRVRDLMRVKGIQKDSGSSSIEFEDRSEEHRYGLLMP